MGESYIMEEYVYWEGMSEALPINHRTKVRATIAERDALKAEVEWSRDKLQQMEEEEGIDKARAEKAEAEVERLRAALEAQGKLSSDSGAALRQAREALPKCRDCQKPATRLIDGKYYCDEWGDKDDDTPQAEAVRAALRAIDEVLGE